MPSNYNEELLIVRLDALRQGVDALHPLFVYRPPFPKTVCEALDALARSVYDLTEHMAKKESGKLRKRA